MKTITYKVWMHIEKIVVEDGEESYEDMDEEFLPLPIGEFDSLEDAVDVIENLHETYYL